MICSSHHWQVGSHSRHSITDARCRYKQISSTLLCVIACVSSGHSRTTRNIIILRSRIRMHKHTIKYASKPTENRPKLVQAQTFLFSPSGRVLQRKPQRGDEIIVCVSRSFSATLHNLFFFFLLLGLCLFRILAYTNRSHHTSPRKPQTQASNTILRFFCKLGLIENSLNFKSIYMYNGRNAFLWI